jgi:hypothetical protein
MIRLGRPLTLLAAIGWAVVGFLAAHQGAYRLVYPDAHVHDAVLTANGHGWLSLASPAVVVALAVAIAAGLAGARRWRHRGVRFAILAGVQIGAYVVIELGERVVSGADGRVLLHEVRDHGFWLTLLVGCALQVLTAWLGSAASRLVARAAERIPATTPHRPVAPGVTPIVDRVVAPPRRRAHRTRAPPLLDPFPQPIP